MNHYPRKSCLNIQIVIFMRRLLHLYQKNCFKIQFHYLAVFRPFPHAILLRANSHDFYIKRTKPLYVAAISTRNSCFDVNHRRLFIKRWLCKVAATENWTPFIGAFKNTHIPSTLSLSVAISKYAYIFL